MMFSGLPVVMNGVLFRISLVTSERVSSTCCQNRRGEFFKVKSECEKSVKMNCFILLK